MHGGITAYMTAAETSKFSAFDRLQDSSGAGVIVNLSKNKIAYCSEAIKNLTGYSREYIFRTDLPELLKIIHPNDRFDYLRYLRLFCNGAPSCSDNCFVNKLFRIKMSTGQCLGLSQKTEIFDYEGYKMLFIQLSKKNTGKFPSVQLLKNISDRELEVLKLLGSGFSSKEIAEKLHISNHTAVSHRKNLIEKFNARNTAHLIRDAYRYLDL